MFAIRGRGWRGVNAAFIQLGDRSFIPGAMPAAKVIGPEDFSCFSVKGYDLECTLFDICDGREDVLTMDYWGGVRDP
jgi:hypothetical protein